MAIAIFLIAAGVLLAQATGSEGDAHFGTVPMELLRPRRDEAPRHPADMVIGPLGPGRASAEKYEFAGRVAAALLAGNMEAQILSSVHRLFLEDYMAALGAVNPRAFRMGSGQESPDGSVSFLVRFIGRDHGITGALFVRQVERQIHLPPEPAAAQNAGNPEGETSPSAYAHFETGEDTDGFEEDGAGHEPPARIAIERVLVFDDLILEPARSREEENLEARQRFGSSAYRRLF